MKITQREWRIVEVYLAAMAKSQRVENAGPPTNVIVERRSDREFDLRIEGSFKFYGFSAWLLLGCIGTRINWCSPEVANMTDYPQMVLAGDWSGVRDTDNDKLWAIFKHFKLDEIKPQEEVTIK